MDYFVSMKIKEYKSAFERGSGVDEDLWRQLAYTLVNNTQMFNAYLLY